jgi:hypothetical protein
MPVVGPHACRVRAAICQTCCTLSLAAAAALEQQALQQYGSWHSSSGGSMFPMSVETTTQEKACCRSVVHLSTRDAGVPCLMFRTCRIFLPGGFEVQIQV